MYATVAAAHHGFHARRWGRTQAFGAARRYRRRFGLTRARVLAGQDAGQDQAAYDDNNPK